MEFNIGDEFKHSDGKTKIKIIRVNLKMVLTEVTAGFGVGRKRLYDKWMLDDVTRLWHPIKKKKGKGKAK
jgi:hypothetical protein